ncbi:uncharacterized protein LOC125097684 isoform X3 [Lutra lutra]|uniref:uncharacterized protein LOC125097684 isoform X3 n=1 Tax=Lutra lutra TaxID=9657 RepID=UPI001FD2DF28|nr:uncharacterized protein LOC125097684 isoform X3 [Lutra lutra]
MPLAPRHSGLRAGSARRSAPAAPRLGAPLCGREARITRRSSEGRSKPKGPVHPVRAGRAPAGWGRGDRAAERGPKLSPHSDLRKGFCGKPRPAEKRGPVRHPRTKAEARREQGTRWVYKMDTSCLKRMCQMPQSHHLIGRLERSCLRNTGLETMMQPTSLRSSPCVFRKERRRSHWEGHEGASEYWQSFLPGRQLHGVTC